MYVNIISSVVIVVSDVVDVAGAAIRPRGKLLACAAVNTFPDVNVVLGPAIVKPYQPKRLESRTPLMVSFKIK